MKSMLPLMLASLALASSIQPAPTADEAAIRRVVAANTAAYNKRDPVALAATSMPDVDHIGVNGIWTSGKDALEKGLTEYFATGGRPVTQDTVERVRLVTPDVALAIVRRAYIRETETRRSIATYVFQKKDGEWRISAFQNTYVQ